MSYYSCSCCFINIAHQNPSPFSVIADEWADQFVRTYVKYLVYTTLHLYLYLRLMHCCTIFPNNNYHYHYHRWPMILIPCILPINMDLLFGVYTLLFYGYGVYLHWGHELALLPAHNPIFNTSYHHYIHHAVSARGRPIFTGFFFKIWDQLFFTTEANVDRKCTCVECRPKRSDVEWKKVLKPDYSVLLSPAWWMSSYARTD